MDAPGWSGTGWSGTGMSRRRPLASRRSFCNASTSFALSSREALPGDSPAPPLPPPRPVPLGEEAAAAAAAALAAAAAAARCRSSASSSVDSTRVDGGRGAWKVSP